MIDDHGLVHHLGERMPDIRERLHQALPRRLHVLGACRQSQCHTDRGWIAVPDGPGLGVTLDEDFVRSRLVSESG